MGRAVKLRGDAFVFFKLWAVSAEYLLSSSDTSSYKTTPLRATCSPLLDENFAVLW